MPAKDQLKHILMVIAGFMVFLVGVVLLVLPGPGLLLVLAGLIILSGVFPKLERHITPVRDRAMKAAEESVSSPLRIVGSSLAGLALIAAGVLWGLRVFSWLPFPGWSTGSSLILSGFVLLGLLAWSYHRTRQT
ncbi:hypothetical protein BLA60_25410 [Actinophytocola xinjiangensis]|uniref:Uncharacterized protein n=1 Tax=Actinophytocola xinjiangensis TaxID=485602 RepID=A0A7Z1AXF3_9PSEU|nr:PGPGW domain-containing protein [Actinophytocola xinjiangensis]OLF08193.1 hypothetical protein BLA60_25410 [Actinophytocola xinjiangensis]